MASGAAFYLLGGTVTGNTAAQGGAVNAASQVPSLPIPADGGTVTGNSAALGGGIYSESADKCKGHCICNRKHRKSTKMMLPATWFWQEKARLM